MPTLLDMHLCLHATVPMLAGLAESPVAVTHLNCDHVVMTSSFCLSTWSLVSFSVDLVKAMGLQTSAYTYHLRTIPEASQTP